MVGTRRAGVPLDFYDVSLVNGYNLPLAIEPRGPLRGEQPTPPPPPPGRPPKPAACGKPSCTFPLAQCPPELAYDGAQQPLLWGGGTLHGEQPPVSAGEVVGCWSACDKLKSAAYCCTGAYAAGPASCPINHYASVFKASCPTAYAYAYDDLSSTYTCRTDRVGLSGGGWGGLAANGYRLTFCPTSTSN